MVQSIENLIEEWKPLEENPVYYISNFGRVKTIDHPVWCKKNNSYSIKKGILCQVSNNNTKGYWRVMIKTRHGWKACSVHRLVATTFIPNPDNLPQINHKDGNKNNNRVDNLEWCTASENQRHAWEHNLKSHKRASLSAGRRKLSPKNVIFIRNKFRKVDTSIRGEQAKFCREMAKKFNLKSPNTIFWVITGGTNKFCR